LPEPVLHAVQELPQTARLRREHDYLPVGLIGVDLCLERAFPTA
jgi:hypothetical protein